MTNHVSPSSNEMCLPVSHCTIFPTSIQTQTPPPIYLSLIYKRTTGILERKATDKALHIIYICFKLLIFWRRGPFFHHINYSSITSVGKIRLDRKVNLVQSGYPRALKLYHMGTCVLHLCLQIENAITLIINQITPSSLTAIISNICSFLINLMPTMCPDFMRIKSLVITH